MTMVIDGQGSVYGPFKTVSVLGDRLRCDAEIDMPFAVVGEYLLTEQHPPGAASDYVWQANAYTLRPEAYARRAGELQAAVVAEAQRRLDAFAHARGYDNIVSLCSYRDDPDPVFSGEASQGLQKRSATWAFFRQMRDNASPGAPLPTYEEVMAAYQQAVPLEWV